MVRSRWEEGELELEEEFLDESPGEDGPVQEYVAKYGKGKEWGQ